MTSMLVNQCNPVSKLPRDLLIGVRSEGAKVERRDCKSQKTQTAVFSFGVTNGAAGAA
jgi:hypothetical protein